MLTQNGSKQIEIPIFFFFIDFNFLYIERLQDNNRKKMIFLVGRRCLGGHGYDVVVVCEFVREDARPCA